MRILAVTGGGQGIGRAIAYRFAAKAYAVSIADADAEAGHEAAERIRAAGGTAIAVFADGGMSVKMIYAE